jgi:hypothetical protein
LLGAPQVRKQFWRSRVPTYFVRENEIVDELAKLGSSLTIVPTWVFL